MGLASRGLIVPPRPQWGLHNRKPEGWEQKATNGKIGARSLQAARSPTEVFKPRYDGWAYVEAHRAGGGIWRMGSEERIIQASLISNKDINNLKTSELEKFKLGEKKLRQDIIASNGQSQVENLEVGEYKIRDKGEINCRKKH